MSLEKRVYSALVVSSSGRFSETLAGFLAGAACDPVDTVSSVSAAERAVAQRAYDLIFINSPLSDDSGVRFAIDSCRAGGTVTAVFVSADLRDQVHSRAAEHGVYVLSRPIPRGTMLQALDWMAVTRERLRSFEKKAQPIQEKMEEIRLVNRAKWLLIQELKMSEPDAHHYITHQAMDRCVPKRTVAEEIIRLYA